jgi:hypothetical protein
MDQTPHTDNTVFIIKTTSLAGFEHLSFVADAMPLRHAGRTKPLKLFRNFFS